MKKLFLSLLCFCFFAPHIGLAQTGSYTNPEASDRQANNAIDIGSIQTQLNSIERYLDIAKDNYQRFLRENDFEDGDIQYQVDPEEYIYDMQIALSDLSLAIDTLRGRLGQSKQHIIPELNILQRRYESLSAAVETLATDADELFTAMTDWAMNNDDDQDKELEKAYIEKQTSYLASLDTSLSRVSDAQEQLQSVNQLLRSFRAPPVLKGGILPGPTTTNMQKNPGEGVRYIAENMIPAIANWIMVALMSVSVIMVILSGLFYIFAKEEEIKEKAKDTLFWVFVGTIVAILSFAIVRLVVGLDIDILP